MVGGGGFEGVTTTAPPPENFNHTLWMSFLTENSAHATKIFIVSSNIGVHQILCNNTDTEAIISMAETNRRLEYLIWDSELKQVDVMERDTCYVGVPKDVPFSRVYFCLKILEQNVNFEEKF